MKKQSWYNMELNKIGTLINVLEVIDTEIFELKKEQNNSSIIYIIYIWSIPRFRNEIIKLKNVLY